MNDENDQQNQKAKAKPEHLPKPTYWPFFMALGLMFAGWGLLSTWLFSVIGLVVFAISLLDGLIICVMNEILPGNKKHESEKEINRRKFLMKLSLSFAGLSAVVVAIPVISALLAPLLEKSKEQWRNIARVTDFAPGTTNLVTFENADPRPYAGITSKSSAWLRRDDKNVFTAFAANCTHLGCPVRWEKGAQLFMCPCHGGVYYKDGTVAAGPPPKPLTQYQVRVYNNYIQIKTRPLPITNITAVR